MKRAGRAIWTAAAVLALCLTVLQNVVLAPHSFTNIAAVQYTDGTALVAQYRGDGLVVEQVTPEGVVTHSFSVGERRSGQLVTLSDMAARQPITEFELLAVRGVGEAKARRYGGAFLEEIKRYLQEKA